MTISEADAALAPYASPMALGCVASRGRYRAAPHVKLISDAFRRCAQKPGGRLLIIAPPRHSKSETVSHYGCAWYLQLYPDRRVLLGSYAAALSQGWGEAVRTTVGEYGPAIGAQLGVRQRVEDWSMAASGGMRTVGFDGAITGRGGHLLVVDDATKGQEAALSPTQQEAIWRRWLADFSTRKEPAGSAKDFESTSIVVVGTRWGERDFLGRLLAAYDAGPTAEGYEPWEILYLPAIADGYDWTGRRPYADPLGRQNGEALWPDAWDEEFLAKEQARNAWWYAALYLGRPQPVQGGLLKAHRWGYWTLPVQSTGRIADGQVDDPSGGLSRWPAEGEDIQERPASREPVYVAVGSEVFPREPVDLPPLVRCLISVDANFAADLQDLSRGRERSDVSVQAWALDAASRKYLLDRVCGQLDLDGTVTVVLGMRARLTPGSPTALALGYELPAPPVLVEPAALGPAVVAQLRRRNVPILPANPPRASKVARVVSAGASEHDRMDRAASFADEQAAGVCYLPHPRLVVAGRPYDWVLDVRHKFSSFPASGKDDTDAASQAWSKLAVAGWRAEDAEKRAEEVRDQVVRTAMGLPRPKPGAPQAPLPTTTQEIMRARVAAEREKLELEAAKKWTRTQKRGYGLRRGLR